MSREWPVPHDVKRDIAERHEKLTGDLKARLLDINESVSVYTDVSKLLRAWSPKKLKALGQEAHDHIEKLEEENRRLRQELDTWYAVFPYVVPERLLPLEFPDE